MHVTALQPTDISVALLGNSAHRSFRDDGVLEPEVVRSGGDRRKRRDRRTEDEVRRRMVYGLEELVWDGTPVPPPARITAAARLFSEGNYFLTGTIVDRSA
jgi:hypothetical protein